MKTCRTCSRTFDDSATHCPHDSQLLVEDLGALVGTRLDGLYEIEALLGQGGMGAVYRARHAELGDHVAIKVLRSNASGNESFLRRFRREGQAARRFRHPNAVMVFDLRVSEGAMPYMVLEYVDGTTLRDEQVARHTFSIDELLPLLEQIASLLDAAHASGVVHRDLKPENIMLVAGTAGPVVKVLDLGIAKLFDDVDAELGTGTNLTVAGQIMGTPPYMSPEQWGDLPRDEGPTIDGRADVYSLAVITYELVAGRMPFNGRTVSEMHRAHLTTRPQPLDEVRADVPAAFARVVDRGMARDRAARPRTAGELVRELAASRSEKATHPGVAAGAKITETIVHAETQLYTSDDSAGMDSATTHIPSSADETFEPESHVESAPSESVSAAYPPVRRAARTGWYVVAAGVVLLAAAALWGLRSVTAPEAPSPAPTAVRAPEPTSPAVPVLRYALEVYADDGSTSLATGRETLRMGQFLRFRFTPLERGYLYIVAPGAGNVPTTFLTSRPTARTGVATNQVEPGVEYVFPREPAGRIGLDGTAATTAFTVIYSPEPLAEPAFLVAPDGRALTPGEQLELESLRRRIDSPSVTVQADGEQSSVTVAQAADRKGSAFAVEIAITQAP